jgi:hypothetical protein
MTVKHRLPPAQSKEDLTHLKTEFGGQYANQFMIASNQIGEENTTKNYKMNSELHQLSAL